MTAIHIYAPPATLRMVRWGTCPDCKQRSPFAILHYEWYGPTSTCMRCGRSWSDYQWMPLDFSRTARQDSKNEARRAWKRAKP